MHNHKLDKLVLGNLTDIALVDLEGHRIILANQLSKLNLTYVLQRLYGTRICIMGVFNL